MKAIITFMTLLVMASGSIHAQDPEPVLLPAGTELLIRTKQILDTDYIRTGNIFTAELAADITQDGRVILPKGSHVEGYVYSSTRAKNIGQKAHIAIEIKSISHQNIWFPVRTNHLGFVGGNDDTGKKTGAGAAIGGILNGFEGAVKGAAIGLGISALTRGKQVHLPEESLLEFYLQEPAEVLYPGM